MKNAWASAFCFFAGTVPAFVRGRWRNEEVIVRLMVVVIALLFIAEIVITVWRG